MPAKVTMVRLTAESLNLTKTFEVNHAERILRLENSRWRVAEGEKLEWTKDGFRPKTNKRGNKKSEQGEND